MAAEVSAPRAVLVVDDHPVVRRGLRDLLGPAGFEVAGEASTGAQAEQLARELDPALAVVDMQLPDTTGDVLIGRLRAIVPAIGILVVTLHADAATARRCLAAGALGVMSKETEPPDLVRALEAVAAGQQILGPGLGEATASAPASPLDGLTPREREVAGGLARGMTNGEIAAELHLSPKTVRNLVSNVLMRLGVDDRVSAALLVDRERRRGDASRDA